jgi:hypothetical protein
VKLPGGRLLEHDPRSKDHPAPSASVHTILWEHWAPLLDQGKRHACTGYAMAQALNAGPIHADPYLDETNALGIYGWATRLDGYPGNDYPEHDLGSSGLGAAKAAVKLGLIARYDHGFGFDHALEALMSGPCIVGGNWKAGMSKPNAKTGFARYTGKLIGGHEWALLGVDVPGKYVVAVNSWGGEWGSSGRFFLPFPDFAQLLADDGDCLLPIR